MAVIGWADRMSPHALTGLPTELKTALLQEHNKFQSGVTNALKSNLDFTHNMNAQWVTNETAVHAKAFSFANPLKNNAIPKAVLVFPNNTPILSYSWTYASGLISLTVNYDCAHTFLTANASGVGLTNATAANVASLSLTPGDWDVSGMVTFGGSPTGYSGGIGSIVTISGGLGVLGQTRVDQVATPGANVAAAATIPITRFAVTVATTIYLTGYSLFSGGTSAAYGIVNARMQGVAPGTNDTPTILVLGG